MQSETVVIGLNWVGDNILALPTYRALQQRFRHEGGIAIAAPEHITTLLASSGIFRKIVPWNGNTRDRIRQLKAGNFRRAVELRDSAELIPRRLGHARRRHPGTLGLLDGRPFDAADEQREAAAESRTSARRLLRSTRRLSRPRST